MDLLAALRHLFVARANSLITSIAPRRERIFIEAPGVEPPLSPEPPPPPPPEQHPASPVFLTPQSLISFPGATLAINILWNLIAVLSKDFAKRAIVPIVLGFIIGIVIYLLSLGPGMSRKEKIIGLVIALINSAWLGLNALGINIVKAPS